MGHETVIQFAPAGVTSAEATFREAPFGEYDQASIVEFHHRANDASSRSLERQMEKFALGIFVNRDDESGEIHADVEQERGRHELGVAQVKVFVLVEGLEPKPVRNRILLIIIRERVRNVFAGQTSRQQIGHEVARVGTEIEPGTVERIDESSSVADADPFAPANFRAPIWHRRKSVDVAFDYLCAAENFRAD